MQTIIERDLQAWERKLDALREQDAPVVAAEAKVAELQAAREAELARPGEMAALTDRHAADLDRRAARCGKRRDAVRKSYAAAEAALAKLVDDVEAFNAEIGACAAETAADGLAMAEGEGYPSGARKGRTFRHAATWWVPVSGEAMVANAVWRVGSAKWHRMSALTGVLNLWHGRRQLAGRADGIVDVPEPRRTAADVPALQRAESWGAPAGLTDYRRAMAEKDREVIYTKPEPRPVSRHEVSGLY